MGNIMGYKIVNNSPALISFILLSAIVLIMDYILPVDLTTKYFSVYKAPLTDIFTWFRFFSHSLGHSDFSHFFGNISSLLITGTLLEERYGTKDFIIIILLVSLITGLIHFIFTNNVALRGASGVVFAFIMLAGITNTKSGEIPVTLILIIVLYLSKEMYDLFFSKNNISNITHIIGGLVGVSYGLYVIK